MKGFFTTIVLGSIAVMSLVYSIDPAGHWHQSTIFSSRNLNPGEVWIYPEANWDERRVKAHHLKLISKPDIALVGSSRSVMVDSRMFAPPYRFFNIGVSGAVVEDYIVFWQMLKDLGKIPSYLVMMVDPWTINRNAGQTRWQAHAEQFTEFLNSIHATPKERRLKEIHRLIAPLKAATLKLADLRDLMSWESFKKALEIAQRPTPDMPKTFESGYLTTEDQRPPEKTGYRWDGSNFWKTSAITPKPPQELRRLALEFAAGEPVFSMGGWEASGEALLRFELLLQDLANQGTRAIIIVAPFPALTLQKLSERPGYSHIAPRFLEAIQASVTKVPGTSYCNALNPETPGCTETEFMDGMHPLRSCAEKVIRHCLGQGEAWKPLLAN